MEDGRRREAPLSFGECPKKEALARNVEEKKKEKNKKEKKSCPFSLLEDGEKKKSHTRQKSSPTKKRKKLFPAPFLHRRDIVAPVFVHFPIFSAELTNCQNCRPFSSSPNLLSSLVRRCPQPPPHERDGGSLSGNLNHPFPSYGGPFSSQLLFSSSCPIQAKASAEGQGGGGGGRRRREKRSWFWSSSSSSTAPLQPPSLHRPSTMEKLFFASHPSSVPYLLLLLFPFPFFPPCPLLLPFSIFPAKWERKITVLAGGGCKKGVSSSSLDRTELGKTNSFFFRAISSIHSE